MKKILTLLSFAAFSVCSVHAQVITTIGGNTAYDYGDGDDALLAAIHDPCAIAVDDSGNVYFSEFGAHVVRKIDAHGIISRVASYWLNGPSGIALDHKGNLFIADSKTNVIRKVNLHNNNLITTAYAGFTNPTDIAFDSYGNLFVCDASNNTIRKIDTFGHMTTVVTGFGAITTTITTGGYGGTTTTTTSGPRFAGITLDKDDNIYITDVIDNVIRKITHEGGMTVIAGNFLDGKTDNCLAVNASLSGPARIAVAPSGDIVFTDRNNCRICKIDGSGMLTTIAGNTTCGFAGDCGNAKDASLNHPAGIVYDRNGFMYIADNGNARIRKVSPWAAAVNDLHKESSIAIVPNPSNGSFTISIPAMGGNDGALLTVIGMNGNLVYQGNMEQGMNGFSKSVSLGEQVASGNYLVVVKTAGETVTSHLVIER